MEFEIKLTPDETRELLARKFSADSDPWAEKVKTHQVCRCGNCRQNEQTAMAISMALATLALALQENKPLEFARMLAQWGRENFAAAISAAEMVEAERDEKTEEFPELIN